MQPEFSNSILLIRGSDCVIFDAWGRASDWAEIIAKRGLNLCAIYSTHGHYDHISAAPELAQKFNIDWYLNHRDLFLIPWANAALDHFGLPSISDDYKRPIDLPAGDLDVLQGHVATIIESPGHSSGGVIFHFKDEKVLIIGDTLFQDTVGRYDLPGADVNELLGSISKIYNMNLSDDTVVIHGHGPNTTIGWLKQNNRHFK